MASRPFFYRKAPGPPPGAVCKNCNTVLVGKYCHVCSQEYTDRPIRLRTLMGEGISEFFSWDSKVLRSVRPLLFKPGFLTKEYVAGRRVRYVAPIRFYLIGSVIFFLVFRIDIPQEAFLDKPDTAEQKLKERQDTRPLFTPADSMGAVADSLEKAKAMAEADSALSEIKKQTGLEINPTFKYDDDDDDDEPSDSTEPAKRKNAHFNFGFTEDGDSTSFWGNFEHSINKKVEKDNGYSLVNKAIQNLPTTLFLLMPFVALLLALLYIRRRRDYMEHLILTLHIHTFVYVFLSVTYATGLLGEYLFDWNAAGITGTSIGFIPIYFHFSLMRYYGQGHLKTFFKMFLLFILYTILISFAAVVLAIIAAYLAYVS